MSRKKVKLAYMTNDSARKATYKKRKKGLMKKARELATLCDISACAIVYSQYDQFEPEVWPSLLGAQYVIEQFKRMPEMEQAKKKMDQVSFLRQRIDKADEQLKKRRRGNREMELKKVMFQTLTGNNPPHGLSILGLNDLGLVIDQNMKELAHKIKSKKDELARAQGASTSTSVSPTTYHGMVWSAGHNPNMVNPQPQENMGFGAAPIEMLPSEDMNNPAPIEMLSSKDVNNPALLEQESFNFP